MDGFIVIDKPEGLTSHDVVRVIRKKLQVKKVGHTGTLDPFATGVLPVAVGEATKAIPFLDESSKEYLSVMHLGITTDTQDRTGSVLQERSCSNIDEGMIRRIFSQFVGNIKQVPPMFSALKRDGVPLYKLAREGKTVERAARDVTIYSLQIENINFPEVSFRVRCSRGTYVRTLAHDLGQALGCGAHLTELRRTASGPFTLRQAISLEKIGNIPDETAAGMISPSDALSHLPCVPLSEKGAAYVRVGKPPGEECFIAIPDRKLASDNKVALLYGHKLLAVAENICKDGCGLNFKLLRVFN